MTVAELKQDQLEELRGNYFTQLEEQTGDEVLQGITDPSEIDMSNVIAHYEGTYFVNDDFFCSMDED
jgi:carbohydrate-selective porin OprB